MMCIICGNSDDEVRKLFCFPKNLDRSNKWQRCMGMVPKGVLSTSFKICDNHFTEDSFIPRTHRIRLKKDAVPTIRPSHQPQKTTSQGKDQDCPVNLLSDRTPEKIPDRTCNKTIDKTSDKTNPQIPESIQKLHNPPTSDKTSPPIPAPSTGFPRVTVRKLGNISPMIVRERFLRDVS